MGTQAGAAVRAAATQRRTYDVLLGDIEANLASGKLAVGEQLPGERVVAETYGISRASVREAIRILDAMGIVDVPTFSGPRSGPLVVSTPSRGMGSALRLHVAAKKLPVVDIVETRILLETWAVRTAPDHLDPDVLQEAHELLEAMDAPGIEARAFHELDARFHVALSRLVGNAVIETMMEALGGSISGYIGDAIAAQGEVPVVLDELRVQHHAIFAAVSAGERETAARLVGQHISWLYDMARSGGEREGADDSRC